MIARNEETIPCVICKRDFLKRIKAAKTSGRKSIRGAHCKTCSPTCSKELVTITRRRQRRK